MSRCQQPPVWLSLLIVSASTRQPLRDPRAIPVVRTSSPACRVEAWPQAVGGRYRQDMQLHADPQQLRLTNSLMAAVRSFQIRDLILPARHVQLGLSTQQSYTTAA